MIANNCIILANAIGVSGSNSTSNTIIEGGEINVVYKKYDVIGIMNGSTSGGGGLGNITLSDVNITVNNLTSNKSYGIYQNGIGGNVQVENCIINVTGAGNNCFGVYNYADGTVQITNSSNNICSLSSKNTGIFNRSTGTIEIGTKDENGKTNIEIIAGTTGIANDKGEFNFYDGKITGTTAIEGLVTNKEDNLEIVTDDNGDGTETSYLTNATIYVAELVDTGARFTKLQEAIDACSTSETTKTLKLLKNNIIIATNEVTVASGQNIKLNLNGKTVKLGQKFINSGKLEIIDEPDEDVTTEGNIITNQTITNNESLTLTSGTITTTAWGNSNTDYYKGILNNKTLIIGENGKLYNTASGSWISLIDNNGGTVTSSGTVEISQGYNYNLYAIHNRNNGEIEINGGLVKCVATYSSSSHYGIYNDGAKSIKVTDGEVTSSTGSYGYGIYSTSKSSTAITIENNRKNFRSTRSVL